MRGGGASTLRLGGAERGEGCCACCGLEAAKRPSPERRRLGWGSVDSSDKVGSWVNGSIGIGSNRDGSGLESLEICRLLGDWTILEKVENDKRMSLFTFVH